MKAPRPSRRQALTLIEVIVVLAVLVILVRLLFPPISRPKAKSQRINCVNNLKTIGVALRNFSSEHSGSWPMDLAVTNGGTREWLADETQLWRHWLRLSNELATPKILLCPSDLQRLPPKHVLSDRQPLAWAGFTNNSRLSYFLGLNASEYRPETILAGDRNLTTNGVPVGPGRLLLQTNTVLGFTAEIHGQAGNLLLGDGSVQQITSGRLATAWDDARKASGLATNVWLVP
jgi:prepilin-type N-terminal cleavage/methylation domain-containing protein